jgi:hypothetical protein
MFFGLGSGIAHESGAVRIVAAPAAVVLHGRRGGAYCRSRAMIPPRLVAAVLAAAPVAMTACGSNDKVSTGAAAPKASVDAHETLDHEECDESGNRVEMLDTNNDGKPDIRRVFDKQSGRELCRVADLNHDGKPDLYEYFDASGAVRRREFCYDDTGTVNAIEYYENGRLAKRAYDTSGRQKIDTWDYFDSGLPTDPKTGRPVHPSRRERDTTGHGRIDQWWTWNGAKVTIARDINGEGKPDPASTITLGGDEVDAGSAAPPQPPAASDGGPSAPVAVSSDAAADGGAR